MINETLWHSEVEVFRAVSGATYDAFPQSDGSIATGTLAAKGTIPIAATKTGTIDSDGINVRGTGTAFTTEMKIGDFIYDGDASIRKITDIVSDTLLKVTHGFPSDLVSASVLHCETHAFRLVQWNSSGTAASELNGATLPVGERALNAGAPLVYDASASNAQISFTCSR